VCANPAWPPLVVMVLIPKWPRSPDPRPGLLGARGHDPPYALAWEYLLKIPTLPPNTLFHSEKGVVLKWAFGDETGNTFYWDNIIGVPVNWFFSVSGFNPPDATSMGWSITLQVQISQGAVPFFTLYGGFKHVIWPAGGWQNEIVQIYENADTSNPPYDCLIQAKPWDYPFGVVP